MIAHNLCVLPLPPGRGVTAAVTAQCVEPFFSSTYPRRWQMGDPAGLKWIGVFRCVVPANRDISFIKLNGFRCWSRLMVWECGENKMVVHHRYSVSSTAKKQNWCFNLRKNLTHVHVDVMEPTLISKVLSRCYIELKCIYTNCPNIFNFTFELCIISILKSSF